MFIVGDRVRLCADFDNEPGKIEAGSRGTVVALGSKRYGYVFVTFDSLADPDIPENTKHNNLEAGLPMYHEEIERI